MEQAPIAVVSTMLTHANVATTSQTYVHLDVEDLRAELARARRAMSALAAVAVAETDEVVERLAALLRPELNVAVIRPDSSNPGSTESDSSSMRQVGRTCRQRTPARHRRPAPQPRSGG